MFTLAEIKAALRLDALDTAEDDYLSALEAAAVAHVEKRTGHYFGSPEVVSERLSISGDADVVYLSDAPAATPALVLSDNGTTLVAEDDYLVEGRALYRVASGSPTLWSSGRRHLVATYTRGHPAGAEPADVRQAVLLLLSHWYEVRVPVALESVPHEVGHTLDAILATWRKAPRV